MVTITAPTESKQPMAQPISKREPHPQAELIRDKFDWWFSHQNLRKDVAVFNYLHAKGPNSAVNVGRLKLRLNHICDPKPSVWQIMDALKDSATVVATDKDHVRRKVPFVYDSDSDDGIWRNEDKLPRLKPVPAHPGIKAGTFKKGTGTGFEENFADAPTTPKEYEEERELYDPRIGYAIERFLARRKMTKPYQKAFGKFLQYGGVYPASRIGQGESKKQIEADEELSKEDKIELCAMYDVDWMDKMDETKWVIDFEGVAKGYLSTEFAEDLDYNYSDIRVDNQCDVLTNFYNYLLHHDVCTEFNDDILAARHISEAARVQLKTIGKLIAQFPTPFSKACSVLFGGEWQQYFGRDTTWADYPEDEDPQMPKGDAKIIVGAALISLANDAIYDAAFPDVNHDNDSCFPGLMFTEKRDITLEVTAIERATKETRQCYADSGVESKQINAAPIGKLTCKYWCMSTEEEWDIPPALHPRNTHDDKYTFWLEDTILADCFIGMKMNATIRKLGPADTDTNDFGETREDSGLWVLDSVSRIYCSFATFLVNDMCMYKFRGVEWHDEVALLGCKHREAEKAREELELLRREAEMKKKDEDDSDDEQNGDSRVTVGENVVETGEMDEDNENDDDEATTEV